MSSLDEQEIERRIKASGAYAPRLTPQTVDGAIVTSRFHQFPETTVTVCCLVLENGFCVIGESAAVDPANFNAEIGREVAYQDARRKVWPLEGYLLKESLHRAPRGEPDAYEY